MAIKSIPTKCVHSGNILDPKTHGLVSPIYPSASFEYIDVEENQYPRYYNTPNQKGVSEKLRDLENGEFCLLFSSGLAAIMTSLFSVLTPGDHAIFQNDLYGGTQSAVKKELNKFGIKFTFVDAVEPENIEEAIRDNTKIIFVESPSNPLIRIVDIKAVSEIGIKNNITTIIDNTFASPINQNPFELGIDVVVHSGTKYLGGHSDLHCGAVITNNELGKNISEAAQNYGGSINALTCYLLERSLKTLSVRVKQQNENAMLIAEFLDDHKKVKRVNYPGLPGHPGYSIAQSQMRGGFGGMLSFDLGTNLNEVNKFVKDLKVITPAMSLGGVETIVSSPAQTSHAKLTPEERAELGIGDGLLRMSVGIEDVNDLIEDLRNTLETF